MVNVGKYSSPMEHLGTFSGRWVSFAPRRGENLSVQLRKSVIFKKEQFEKKHGILVVFRVYIKGILAAPPKATPPVIRGYIKRPY